MAVRESLYLTSQPHLLNVYWFLLLGHRGTEEKRIWTISGPASILESSDLIKHNKEDGSDQRYHWTSDLLRLYARALVELNPMSRLFIFSS